MAAILKMAANPRSGRVLEKAIMKEVEACFPETQYMGGQAERYVREEMEK